MDIRRLGIESEVVVFVTVGAAAFVEMLTFGLLGGQFWSSATAGDQDQARRESEYEGKKSQHPQNPGARILRAVQSLGFGSFFECHCAYAFFMSAYLELT